MSRELVDLSINSIDERTFELGIFLWVMAGIGTVLFIVVAVSLLFIGRGSRKRNL